MLRVPIVLFILLLAGCASYSGIHGEARALAPQSLAFHSEDGTWPREDWWSAFGDPKLDALVHRALEGNPSLRAAQARVRSVSALADGARASLFPDADGSRGAGAGAADARAARVAARAEPRAREPRPRGGDRRAPVGPADRSLPRRALGRRGRGGARPAPARRAARRGAGCGARHRAGAASLQRCAGAPGEPAG